MRLSCGRAFAPTLVGLLLAGSVRAQDQEALDVERYVGIVLRSHPGAAQSAGLEVAAAAEHKAARLLPDPVFAYSQDRATAPDGSGPSVTERGYSVSQTIPWPGSFSAGVHAGDRASEGLRAEATAARWELVSEARIAFARLLAARALLDVAKAAEEDARSLRDLVARRADLGESRESDRIKATVEWLREERNLAAAQRQAESSEVAVRLLAVEPLPRPLAVRTAALAPALDRDAVLTVLAQNPRLIAARAEAGRRQALASVARRSRVPDLDLTLFHNEELDKHTSGLSLGLKVPLWNANRGEIARAEAAVTLAAAQAERTRIDLSVELEARVKEVEVASAQAVLLDKEILPAASRSVGIARFSFEEGETSLLDLLDAQRTYRDTQREAAEAHLALSVANAELEALVGPAGAGR